jgi:hypothetical protein
LKKFLSFLQDFLFVACENEQITLKVIPLRDLPVEVPDAKALSALMLYQTLQSFGAL